ncbi:MAG: hypothetical protein BRC40_16980 [Cyanobacteria bacterium QH_8_48_120]|jgi:hypothetical protein|nr:MAG: hypothetical protein BRC34_07995 [Cyanobacteria bacterium QH_1_48_107]PSO55749.1 MAG: hypothetical protein BRC35_11190 [Cyanobacteria bacterium QH_10_48_56]PSO65879.1 MAG: hypothetical protein BRC38_07525 [Cyanobacteria bacterium QH_6_48_35]PSO68671.1 MAG: hypothetical protein BRC40_16980 [Cyanobacteria bacterium QH_8_48_120]
MEKQDSPCSSRFFRPQPYLKVSEANKVEVITDRLLELTIYKVLPRVQPNLEALLHYSLRGAFKDSEFYKNLQQVPGIPEWPEDFVETLANQVAQTSVKILASSYSDAEGRKLFERLSSHVSQAAH